MKRLADLLAPVVFVSLLLAGWELACRAFEVPSYRLPPPSAIGEALRESGPLLLSSGWNTLSTALIALAVASVLASALALLAAPAD